MNQELSDRWESLNRRYAELQAEIQREYMATHGSPTSARLAAKARIARVEIEELKRELARRDAAPA